MMSVVRGDIKWVIALAVLLGRSWCICALLSRDMNPAANMRRYRRSIENRSLKWKTDSPDHKEKRRV